MRRLLFRVHMWIGLLVGFYIAAVFATGAALVYRVDLQRALDPHLFAPRVAGPLADAATVMERVSDAYPQHALAGVDAPTTARPTYLAYVTSGQELVTVLIDPVSTEILGELPERALIRILRDIHYNLLAGGTGRIINGLGAGCVLGLCVTGVMIWWPGTGSLRRGFGMDFRRGGSRVIWESHRAVGIWTVTLIAVWALTGLYFVFPSQVRSIVNRISPITVRRPPLSGLRSQPGPSENGLDRSAPGAGASGRPTWRAAVAEAQRHAPAQHVARVVVPSTERAAFLVLLAESSPTPVGPGSLTPIYVDQFTLERLPETPRGRRTTGDVVMAWMTPLHVGNFGGEPVKVAWLVLGLAPPLLFVTGFIMWWTRVVRPRRAAETDG